MYYNNGERYYNNRDVYYNYNPYYSQNYPNQGPSPVIPFLILVCLGFLVSGGTMQDFGSLFEAKESAEQSPETLALTLIIIILFAVLSCCFMGDAIVTVGPIATLLFVFLLQNEVLCILVLLLVLTFFTTYSNSSQTGGSYQYGWNSNWSTPVYQPVPVYQSIPDCQFSNAETGERVSDLPFSLTPGQICYLIMVGCLMSCTMSPEDQNIWWTCMGLVFACVLYVHFSGHESSQWIL